MQVLQKVSVCRCHHVIATLPSWNIGDKTGIKAIMEEIEKVDSKLYEELGGKKTADKKENYTNGIWGEEKKLV